MKLDDLQSPMNSVQLAQLLKKHHGIQLPVAQLTPARAQGMLESVQTQLNQYRNSKSAHLAEQDSNYTAMMLVEQTLRARVTEYTEPLTRKISRWGQSVASAISPGTGEAWRNYTDSDSSAASLAKRMLSGANTGVEAANWAARKLKKRPKPTKVMESAMGEAEVILAAKDLADRVQDMVETLGKMINEELPALTETIRDTMEATQADTYNTSALESLNATLEAVRGSKESLDVAARSLAGEEPAAPVDAGTDEFSGDVTEPELGAEDTGEVADELMNTPAVASGGKKQPLGRGKR